MGKFSGAPYNGGYPYDDEPPEESWFPNVGENVKIACDWTMRQGEIGAVKAIEPYKDQDGEIAGASIIVSFDDGSQDGFEIDDLIHPDEELFPYEDDEDEDDYGTEDEYDLCGCPYCFCSASVLGGGICNECLAGSHQG